jgi:hypothetical protein
MVSNRRARAQKLLETLYEGLDEEERKLSDGKHPFKPEADGKDVKPFFAELYRTPGGRVKLVGPVGERPVHVCMLRAGALDKEPEMRAGLIEGVK